VIGFVTIYPMRDNVIYPTRYNVARTYLWWRGELGCLEFVTSTGAPCPDREDQTTCAGLIARVLGNILPDPDATSTMIH
jgi:hypothetical protein